MNSQVILWDWNGTLLDDLRYAIKVRNRVFPRFGLPVIEDVQDYLCPVHLSGTPVL